VICKGIWFAALRGEVWVLLLRTCLWLALQRKCLLHRAPQLLQQLWLDV
jgi:hypothetical protein